MIEESYFDDLDRKFLSLASSMAGIFSNTYGRLGYRLIAPLDPSKFDNAATRAQEIGIRTLIAVGVAFSLFCAGTFLCLTAAILGLGSKIFHHAGLYFQKEGFTHIKGEAPEQPLSNGQLTIMTWNVRGHDRGLHYSEAGVVHWSQRLDAIAQSIRDSKAHIAILQEVYDTAFKEALISKLQGDFAHIYLHIGESGLMIFSKCPTHSFSKADFAASDAKIPRGFAILELKAKPTDSQPCVRIIGTHLTPGKEAKATREKQIDEVIQTLARRTSIAPTLFVGSMGIDRNNQEEASYLAKYFSHSYQDSQPTHSYALANQWAPIYEGQEASSDFISLVKRTTDEGKILPVLERGVQLVESRLGDGFDETNDTKKALSDHRSVITTLKGLRSL